MLRSMNSAITALSLHQVYMDTVANNLANVNTTAYKANRVDFKTQISQLQSVGNAPTAAAATPSLGGRNPMQIGLGVALGAITKVMTQGSLRATGRATDLAVQGNGYFIVDDSSQTHAFTRDGAVDIGQDGKLTQIATGLHLMGWNLDPTTNLIDTTGPLTAINVPSSAGNARATTQAKMSGNLNSQAAAAATVDMTIAVYDSLGTPHNITVQFTHGAVGSNVWTPAITGVYANPPYTAAPTVTISTGTLQFDAQGQLTAPLAPANTFNLNLTLNNGATTPQAIALDATDVTQLATTSNVSQVSQDGLAPGTLTGLSVVSDTGQVMGTYTNGLTQAIGQIALANFINPEGLLATGQNLYRPWLNSGDPQIGSAGTGAWGMIASGNLESSNVDLAQEFTNMITAQRGFQSNSRVITTSDEMLQELVNMKR